MKITSVAVAIALCAAACGGKKGDPAKGDPSAKGADPVASGDDDRPSDDSIAYALGAKLAMIDAFVILNKPDKAAGDLDDAKGLAKALDLDPPHMPASGEDEAMPIAKKLKASKPEHVFQCFVLGNRLHVAWFGVKIGADTSMQLHDVQTAAAASGIPASEWKTQLDAIVAKPDADAIDKLGDSLQAYLEHTK